MPQFAAPPLRHPWRRVAFAHDARSPLGRYGADYVRRFLQKLLTAPSLRSVATIRRRATRSESLASCRPSSDDIVPPGWFRRRHPWPPCLWQPITLTRYASSLLAIARRHIAIACGATALVPRDQPSSRFRRRSASTTITSTRPRGARASLVCLSRCRSGALRCSVSQRDLTHLTALAVDNTIRVGHLFRVL